MTIPVAATDTRVKALVLMLPFISGLIDSEAFPEGHVERLWKEREARASSPRTSEEPVYVQIFPDSVEAAKQNPHGTVIGTSGAVGFYEGTKALSDAAGTPWENKVTVQTLFHQRRWEPTVFLPQITVPLLYVSGKHDEFTPQEKHTEAYEKIHAPKDLLIVDSGNLEAFGSEKIRNMIVEKQLQFLQRNL